MALAWTGQDDFAAGVLRSSGRDMDTGVGVSNSINGFFDDDGDVYLRGRTRAYSERVGDFTPLHFIWTGDLATGPTGLVSSDNRYWKIEADGNLTGIGGVPVQRPVKPAILQGKLYMPNNQVWDGGLAVTGSWMPTAITGQSGSAHIAACGERLVIGQGRIIRFSAAKNPASWNPTDYHELPEGARVRGLAAIKDTLVVFTGYGIWAIMNLALDLTDDDGNPQQVMQKLLPELGLLHESGITEWSGKIVAPCGDRVLMLDTISPPVTISDSIAPLYREHVEAGRLPGGAKVFANHLFLPWLDASGDAVTTMVCRLNRPVRARMTYYPWTILDGHAAGMVMGDIAAISDVHTMLVAHQDGHVLDYGQMFNPDALAPADADTLIPVFDLETRDFPTGNGQPNHVRSLRLNYTLRADAPAHLSAAFTAGGGEQTYEQLRLGAGLSNPPVPLLYSDVNTLYPNYTSVLRAESSAADWPAAPWAEDRTMFWSPLAEVALASEGVDPAKWILGRPKRIRYIRARFRCTDPVRRLVVHRVGFGVRPASHQR